MNKSIDQKKIDVLKEKIINVSLLIEKNESTKKKLEELTKQRNKYFKWLKKIYADYQKAEQKSSTLEASLEEYRRLNLVAEKAIEEKDLRAVQLQQLIDVYKVERKEYGVLKVDRLQSKLNKVVELYIKTVKSVTPKAERIPQWFLEEYRSDLKKFRVKKVKTEKPDYFHLPSPAWSQQGSVMSADSGFSGSIASDCSPLQSPALHYATPLPVKLGNSGETGDEGFTEANDKQALVGEVVEPLSGDGTNPYSVVLEDGTNSDEPIPIVFVANSSDANKDPIIFEIVHTFNAAPQSALIGTESTHSASLENNVQDLVEGFENTGEDERLSCFGFSNGESDVEDENPVNGLEEGNIDSDEQLCKKNAVGENNRREDQTSLDCQLDRASKSTAKKDNTPETKTPCMNNSSETSGNVMAADIIPAVENHLQDPPFNDDDEGFEDKISEQDAIVNEDCEIAASSQNLAVTDEILKDVFAKPDSGLPIVNPAVHKDTDLSKNVQGDHCDLFSAKHSEQDVIVNEDSEVAANSQNLGVTNQILTYVFTKPDSDLAIVNPAVHEDTDLSKNVQGDHCDLFSAKHGEQDVIVNEECEVAANSQNLGITNQVLTYVFEKTDSDLAIVNPADLKDTDVGKNVQSEHCDLFIEKHDPNNLDGALMTTSCQKSMVDHPSVDQEETMENALKTKTTEPYLNAVDATHKAVKSEEKLMAKPPLVLKKNTGEILAEKVPIKSNQQAKPGVKNESKPIFQPEEDMNSVQSEDCGFIFKSCFNAVKILSPVPPSPERRLREQNEKLKNASAYWAETTGRQKNHCKPIARNHIYSIPSKFQAPKSVSKPLNSLPVFRDVTERSNADDKSLSLQPRAIWQNPYEGAKPSVFSPLYNRTEETKNRVLITQRNESNPSELSTIGSGDCKATFAADTWKSPVTPKSAISFTPASESDLRFDQASEQNHKGYDKLTVSKGDLSDALAQIVSDSKNSEVNLVPSEASKIGEEFTLSIKTPKMLRAMLTLLAERKRKMKRRFKKSKWIIQDFPSKHSMDSKWKVKKKKIHRKRKRERKDEVKQKNEHLKPETENKATGMHTLSEPPSPSALELVCNSNKVLVEINNDKFHAQRQLLKLERQFVENLKTSEPVHIIERKTYKVSTNESAGCGETPQVIPLPGNYSLKSSAVAGTKGAIAKITSNNSAVQLNGAANSQWLPIQDGISDTMDNVKLVSQYSVGEKGFIATEELTATKLQAAGVVAGSNPRTYAEERERECQGQGAFLSAQLPSAKNGVVDTKENLRKSLRTRNSRQPRSCEDAANSMGESISSSVPPPSTKNFEDSKESLKNADSKESLRKSLRTRTSSSQVLRLSDNSIKIAPLPGPVSSYSMESVRKSSRRSRLSSGLVHTEIDKPGNLVSASEVTEIDNNDSNVITRKSLRTQTPFLPPDVKVQSPKFNKVETTSLHLNIGEQSALLPAQEVSSDLKDSLKRISRRGLGISCKSEVEPIISGQLPNHCQEKVRRSARKRFFSSPLVQSDTSEAIDDRNAEKKPLTERTVSKPSTSIIQPSSGKPAALQATAATAYAPVQDTTLLRKNSAPTSFLDAERKSKRKRTASNSSSGLVKATCLGPAMMQGTSPVMALDQVERVTPTSLDGSLSHGEVNTDSSTLRRSSRNVRNCSSSLPLAQNVTSYKVERIKTELPQYDDCHDRPAKAEENIAMDEEKVVPYSLRQSLRKARSLSKGQNESREVLNEPTLQCPERGDVPNKTTSSPDDVIAASLYALRRSVRNMQPSNSVSLQPLNDVVTTESKDVLISERVSKPRNVAADKPELEPTDNLISEIANDLQSSVAQIRSYCSGPSNIDSFAKESDSSGYLATLSYVQQEIKSETGMNDYPSDNESCSVSDRSNSPSIEDFPEVSSDRKRVIREHLIDDLFGETDSNVETYDSNIWQEGNDSNSSECSDQLVIADDLDPSFDYPSMCTRSSGAGSIKKDLLEPVGIDTKLVEKNRWPRKRTRSPEDFPSKVETKMARKEISEGNDDEVVSVPEVDRWRSKRVLKSVRLLETSHVKKVWESFRGRKKSAVVVCAPREQEVPGNIKEAVTVKTSIEKPLDPLPSPQRSLRSVTIAKEQETTKPSPLLTHWNCPAPQVYTSFEPSIQADNNSSFSPMSPTFQPYQIPSSKPSAPKKRRADGSLLDDIMVAMEKQADEIKQIVAPKPVVKVPVAKEGKTKRRKKARKGRRQRQEAPPTRENLPVVHYADEQLKKAGDIFEKFLTAQNKTPEEAACAVKECLDGLKPIPDSIVVKAIVGIVLENVEEEQDSSFSPPAPPLTPTQHRLFALFSASKRLPGLYPNMLTEIRRKIMPEVFFWPDDSIESCARFYSATCRQMNDRAKAVWLCLDALTSMEQRGHIVVNAVLNTWSELLPKAELVKPHSLYSTLAFLILQVPPRKRPAQEVKRMILRNLVMQLHGYKCEETKEKFVAGMLEGVISNEPGSVNSVSVIAKKFGWKWASENVLMPLMNVIKSWEDDTVPNDTGARVLRTLRKIMEVFPAKDEKAKLSVKTTVDKLCAVLYAGKIDQYGEENIVKVILPLWKFIDTHKLLNPWIKTHNASPTLRIAIKREMSRSVRRPIDKRKSRSMQRKKRRSIS